MKYNQLLPIKGHENHIVGAYKNGEIFDFYGLVLKFVANLKEGGVSVVQSINLTGRAFYPLLDICEQSCADLKHDFSDQASLTRSRHITRRYDELYVEPVKYTRANVTTAHNHPHEILELPSPLNLTLFSQQISEVILSAFRQYAAEGQPLSNTAARFLRTKVKNIELLTECTPMEETARAILIMLAEVFDGKIETGEEWRARSLDFAQEQHDVLIKARHRNDASIVKLKMLKILLDNCEEFIAGDFEHRLAHISQETDDVPEVFANSLQTALSSALTDRGTEITKVEVVQKPGRPSQNDLSFLYSNGPSARSAARE